MDTRVTPREAEQEARSAGNAISGQSYGLLNNRAAIAFFRKVRAAGYANDILPVALIHDAIYILVRDDVEILKWANDNLTHEMSWQELPEIQHDVIKLGAELDIFYPSWKESITLPNHASTTEILDIVDAALLEKETK